MLKATDIIYSVAKHETSIVLVAFKANLITYDSPQLNYKYLFQLAIDDVIKLNALYVLEAMKLFKAAGYEEIDLYYHGRMRPITFESDNLLALILPVRTY